MKKENKPKHSEKYEKLQKMTQESLKKGKKLMRN